MHTMIIYEYYNLYWPCLCLGNSTVIMQVPTVTVNLSPPLCSILPFSMFAVIYICIAFGSDIPLLNIVDIIYHIWLLLYYLWEGENEQWAFTHTSTCDLCYAVLIITLLPLILISWNKTNTIAWLSTHRHGLPKSPKSTSLITVFICMSTNGWVTELQHNVQWVWLFFS